MTLGSEGLFFAANFHSSILLHICKLNKSDSVIHIYIYNIHILNLAKSSLIERLIRLWQASLGIFKG